MGEADSRGAPAGAHWQGSPRSQHRRAGRLCAISKIEELHFDAVCTTRTTRTIFACSRSTCRPRCSASPSSRNGAAMNSACPTHFTSWPAKILRAARIQCRWQRIGDVRARDLHLRVLLERMSERYGVKVKTHPPSVPYRETVTRPADGRNRTRNRRAAPAIRRSAIAGRTARAGRRFLNSSMTCSAVRSPHSTFRPWRRACARCSPRAPSQAIRCAISG